MKARRIICVLLLVCMVSTIFAGCSQEKGASESRTVVDMSGKTIELPEEIDKYAILYSSAVSMCGMLDKGFEHLCVCPTLYADWTFELFPDLSDHAITVDKRSVTAEQIVEEGTQVVFWSTSSEELIESLESLGVACVNVLVQSADDLLKAMNIIAETLGTDYAKSQYKKYEETVERYHDYAIEHAAKIPDGEKKTILSMSSISDPTAYGEGSIEEYWADLVNPDPIIPSDDGAVKVTLTMEQVYEFNPDIVLFETFYSDEDLETYPEWTAYAEDSSHIITAAPSVLDTWAKAGAEMPLQFIWALATFYPDYAGDIDVQAEAISFYKEFYQYEMSEADASEMLAGHRIIFG